MFPRAFVTALALFVTSSVAQRGHDHAGDCNIGSLHCCDAVIAGSGNTQTTAVGALNGILTGVVPIVPVTCVPVSLLIGINTINCNGQTACCEDSNFNGINLLTCTPVNVAI